MTLYLLYRPADPLTHVFLQIFNHYSIDLNEIYRTVYNLDWIHMALIVKSSLPSMYNIEKRRIINFSRVQC